MKNDELIKQILLEATKEIDELITEKNDIQSYLKLGFRSSTGSLVRIAYVMAIILTALLMYAAYRFYISAPADGLFWGVCLILSFNAQVATKLWIFSQNNKNYIAKEIRLMELRLGQRLLNGETNCE